VEPVGDGVGVVRPCAVSATDLGYQQLCQRHVCHPAVCVQSGGHCNKATGKCVPYEEACLTNALNNNCPQDRPTCVALSDQVRTDNHLDDLAGQCGCTHATDQDYDDECSDPLALNAFDKMGICLTGDNHGPAGRCAGCTDGKDGVQGVDTDNCPQETYTCQKVLNNGVEDSPWQRTCQKYAETKLARIEYANDYLIEQERKVNALRLAELESKLKTMKARRLKKNKKKGYGTWRY